ncbi:hypothetical protein Tco_1489070 [Tanacetum coccineum]
MDRIEIKDKRDNRRVNVQTDHKSCQLENKRSRERHVSQTPPNWLRKSRGEPTVAEEGRNTAIKNLSLVTFTARSMTPHAVKILDWGDLMTYSKYSRPLGLGRTITLGLWPNQADNKHNEPELSPKSHWSRLGYNKTDADWSQAAPARHQRIS